MRRLILCMALLNIVWLTASAQWTVPTGSTIGNQKVIEVPINAGGSSKAQALMYMPDDYNSTSKKYPVFIFLHGVGEGQSNDINELFHTSLPKLIRDGLVPQGTDSATGQTVKWITVSPHAASTNYSYQYAQLRYIVPYLVNTYRIDPSCIWIGGLSAGGSGTWSNAMNDLNFSNSLAGIMPLANGGWDNNFNNDTYRSILDQSMTNGLAVLSSVGTQDPGYNNAKIYEAEVRKYAQPNKVLFYYVPNGTHSTNVWDPPFYLNTTFWAGKNAWTRMWSLRRGGSTSTPPATNQNPTANAGADKSITLPTNTVTVTGTGTDPDGSIVSYAWTKQSGGAATIASPSSASTAINGLTQGSYVFRLTVTDNKGATAFDDVAVTVNAAATTPPPASSYKALPAKIEAEAWSAMNGVQTESTSDAGGGQDVGWIDLNDWMDYNVNVAAAGNFTVSFRVSTPNSGAKFQLRKSDGTVLATVSVPTTGGYQNWQTVTASVNLPAGNQTLRVVSTIAQNWNINWIDFASSAASQQPPVSSTSRVEAENWSAMKGVQTEATKDAGGGKDVGWIDQGDYMDYDVTISAAGTYQMNFRVATPNSGIRLEVRNASGTVLASVPVPITGGPQTWQTASANVTLPAGAQKLRIYAATAQNWNFNWFEIASSGTASTAARSADNATIESGLSVSPATFTDKFTATLNTTETGAVTLQLIDASGAVKKEFSLNKSQSASTQYYLSAKEIPAGTYTLKAQVNSWTASQQVQKQ